MVDKSLGRQIGDRLMRIQCGPFERIEQSGDKITQHTAH